MHFFAFFASNFLLLCYRCLNLTTFRVGRCTVNEETGGNMAVSSKSKTTKKTSTSKAKKGAFGGYTVNFNGCDDSLENVFGKGAIPPSQMTKKLWAYVKKNKLNNK